jgi:hypothetical protein
VELVTARIAVGLDVLDAATLAAVLDEVTDEARYKPGCRPSASLYTPDLDGDGDVDLLWGAHVLSGWYENLDGKGSFGVMRSLNDDHNPSPVDFDGDGDVDALTSKRTLVWLKNTDGAGSFGKIHQMHRASRSQLGWPR